MLLDVEICDPSRMRGETVTFKYLGCRHIQTTDVFTDIMEKGKWFKNIVWFFFSLYTFWLILVFISSTYIMS